MRQIAYTRQGQPAPTHVDSEQPLMFHGIFPSSAFDLRQVAPILGSQQAHFIGHWVAVVPWLLDRPLNVIRPLSSLVLVRLPYVNGERWLEHFATINIFTCISSWRGRSPSTVVNFNGMGKWCKSCDYHLTSNLVKTSTSIATGGTTGSKTSATFISYISGCTRDSGGHGSLL